MVRGDGRRVGARQTADNLQQAVLLLQQAVVLLDETLDRVLHLLFGRHRAHCTCDGDEAIKLHRVLETICLRSEVGKESLGSNDPSITLYGQPLCPCWDNRKGHPLAEFFAGDKAGRLQFHEIVFTNSTKKRRWTWATRLHVDSNASNGNRTSK